MSVVSKSELNDMFKANTQGFSAEEALAVCRSVPGGEKTPIFFVRGSKADLVARFLIAQKPDKDALSVDKAFVLTYGKLPTAFLLGEGADLINSDETLEELKRSILDKMSAEERLILGLA
ncbi:MAG: hypothetical protein IT514_15265 [Burkholderiales bacterium]|nr:hypothetical protein [Burkholderiales bacterium]